MRINCIIVEDEPLAGKLLEEYVQQVSFLHLSGICKDALSAMKTLKEEKIDLMFLDINLPKLKGLDFLKTLKNPPAVILTTAYHEYALESYDYGVLDYLLKPIEFSRFLVAINKVVPAAPEPSPVSKAGVTPGASSNAYLFFNVNKKKARVVLDEVLYIESIKENVKIVTLNKTIVTKYNISQLELDLPAANFLRIHRSFIVAKNKVDFFDANDVEIRGKEIPIGRSYKDVVFKELGQV
jgi:DNA-binding LytR/AlgR family response regulator